MKKTVVFIVAFALVFAAQTALAGQKPNGQPFQEIWTILDEKINAFEDGIKVLKEKLLDLEIGLANMEDDVAGLITRGEYEARLEALEDRLDECGCNGSAEACDGQDNDGDGLVDEDFDLSNDRDNCGACGHACRTDEECNAGQCRTAAVCQTDEMTAFEFCRANCGDSDTLCLAVCTVGLSSSCLGAYEDLMACASSNCYPYANDDEMLEDCMQAECAEEYAAVYGYWADPACGDAACTGNENHENCPDDCPAPTHTTCGAGACAVTVPFGEECIPLDPTWEICDGIDNDCDGEKDEGNEDVHEQCDGLDNDGDCYVDEDVNEPELMCQGYWECIGSGGWRCQ